MKTCKTFPIETLGIYKYVVVISLFHGQLMLSRHKKRLTWETQGGHIEAEESPLEAAKRELYEESGARKFQIKPVCDYRAADEVSAANGVVFAAVIEELGEMPESEMKEVSFFDELPENLTYPEITPVLMERALKKSDGMLCFL